MTAEMVERVAETMLREAGVDHELARRIHAGEMGLSATYPATLWPEMLKASRAFIAAMREPTPEMLETADSVIPSGFLWGRENGDPSGCRIIYHAMIDAALKE